MTASKPQKKNRAIFLDRDGVLIHDSGYVFRRENLRILPGVAEALNRFHKAGYRLIVITNQSGVARGYFGLPDVDALHRWMQSDLLLAGGPKLDGIYVCPHYPKASIPEFAIECECRKPGIKLLQQAAAEHDLDLSQCFFVGDRPSDIECAKTASAKAYQVKNEKEKAHSYALAQVDDLLAASKKIIP